jgi:hypothetical protein
MRTIVLQPWTTVTLDTTFIQGAEGWIDLGDYADAFFAIDVSSIYGGPVTFTIETSPSSDETYFQPAGVPLTLKVGTQFYKSVRSQATTPIARWVRWRLNTITTGSSVTMRVRVSPARQAFFNPAQLSGCVLWLRADFVTADRYGNIEEWDDQSATGDPNEDLFPASYTLPTYNATDADYNGLPSVSTNISDLSLQPMQSSAWATPLQQPSTWIVVANSYSEGYGDYRNQCLLDANDATTGQSIYYDSSADTVTILANGSGVTASLSWDATSALLGEWNGDDSNLYFNDFTTPVASGSVGGGDAGSQGSMSLFSSNISLGGGAYWDGSVAEIVAYTGILSTAAKAQLRLYLNTRYNLSIA